MNYLNELDLKELLSHALKEDIGTKDITTESFIPSRVNIKAIILAKQDCVVCGLGVASQILKLKDASIRFKPCVGDGAIVKKGACIARISGKAQSVLTAERVMLNFLSILSGISTKTRRYVEAVKPYKVKVLDTRKTIPCLRLLEKYAVRIGGGFNHRLRLDEMFMIKDNHIKTIGFKEIIARSTRKKVRARKLEIEVANLKEFNEALQAKPDIIMLDNMPLADIRRAVRLRNAFSHGHRPKLEASGGITLDNIRKVASCGVEMISIGALTHSLDAVDISLEIL